MGLRPKIPEMPLPHEIWRVPDVGRHASAGTDSVWAVRSGVVRLPAARNDDAGHRPATIQLPFPTTVVGQSEESERLLPGTNACDIVRNSRNTIAACDAFVEDEVVVETVTPERAD